MQFRKGCMPSGYYSALSEARPGPIRWNSLNSKAYVLLRKKLGTTGVVMYFFARTLIVALGLAILPAAAQYGANFYFSPPVLTVGSGATKLSIFPPVPLPSDVAAKVNGADRPIARDTNSSSRYTIDLTAADVAHPGLAEIALYDSKKQTTLATSFVSINYPVQATGVAWDRTRNRAYIATAAASNSTAFPANSVVAYDPQTDTTGPVFNAGAVVGSLALADDASVLYVVVEGSGVIRKLDPATLTAQGDINFRVASGAITVMPGRPATLGVCYHPQPGFSGISAAILDNGVKRNLEASGLSNCDSVMFSPDGQYLLAGISAPTNTGGGMLRYKVAASGISQEPPASAFGGAPVAVINGAVYGSRGTVIDLATFQITGNLGVGRSVAVDSANRRLLAVYYQTMDNSAPYPGYLQAFDLNTLEALGWQNVESINYFDSAVRGGGTLLRWGTDGVLYCSPANGITSFRTPLAAPAPATSPNAVIHAASLTGGPIAPGEIVSIFGTNLGPAAPLTGSPNVAGALPNLLGNIQVWFDRYPATLLLASQGQLNVVAPFELVPGAKVNLQVWNFGIPSAKAPLTVASATPALFTRDGSGKGLASLINQDNSINTPSPAGSVVTLYGTGGGAFPGAADGALARGAASLKGQVKATIGGVDAPVIYAGAAPGLTTGVFQINILVPGGTPPGLVPITITVDGIASPQGVTLEVR